jgi:hypothetical protein
MFLQSHPGFLTTSATSSIIRVFPVNMLKSEELNLRLATTRTLATVCLDTFQPELPAVFTLPLTQLVSVFFSILLMILFLLFNTQGPVFI